MTKQHLVAFRIDLALFKKIKDKSRHDDRSISQTIRVILKRHFSMIDDEIMESGDCGYCHMLPAEPNTVLCKDCISCLEGQN